MFVIFRACLLDSSIRLHDYTKVMKRNEIRHWKQSTNKVTTNHCEACRKPTTNEFRCQAIKQTKKKILESTVPYCRVECNWNFRSWKNRSIEYHQIYQDTVVIMYVVQYCSCCCSFHRCLVVNDFKASPTMTTKSRYVMF